MIERTEIDNYVHEHFKNKFQTKREELNKLDDITPVITQHYKDSISHKITQTETNKSVLKLKDDSSPAPDGIGH